MESNALIFDRLLAIAAVHDVLILQSWNPSAFIGGTYFPTIQTIQLNIDPTETTTRIVILAHELGHAFDNAQRPWAFDMESYHYTTPMSRMDLEMRAWDISITILDACGFTNWDEFERWRAVGLCQHEIDAWDGNEECKPIHTAEVA